VSLKDCPGDNIGDAATVGDGNFSATQILNPLDFRRRHQIVRQLSNESHERFNLCAANGSDYRARRREINFAREMSLYRKPAGHGNELDIISFRAEVTHFLRHDQRVRSGSDPRKADAQALELSARRRSRERSCRNGSDEQAEDHCSQS
jgi:hypothetical protein